MVKVEEADRRYDLPQLSPFHRDCFQVLSHDQASGHHSYHE